MNLKDLTPDAVKGVDLLMVIVAHNNVDYEMMWKNAKAVFDTKNVMADIRDRENIEVNYP